MQTHEHARVRTRLSAGSSLHHHLSAVFLLPVHPSHAYFCPPSLSRTSPQVAGGGLLDGDAVRCDLGQEGVVSCPAEGEPRAKEGQLVQETHVGPYGGQVIHTVVDERVGRADLRTVPYRTAGASTDGTPQG